MMDIGDTQTHRKGNDHNSAVSHIKAPSAGSRFPYKWGAIVPNLFSVQGNNCAPSLAYIWMSIWSTHIWFIYLMDIWQKIFSLNRFFWSSLSVRSSHSLPQLTEGSFFPDFWSSLSRQPQIAVRANYTQNKYCHRWLFSLFFFAVCFL